MTEACEEADNLGGNHVKKGNIACQENHGDKHHNGGINQFFVFLKSFGFGITIPRPRGLAEFCFDFVNEGGDFPEHACGVDGRSGMDLKLL